MTPQNAEFMVAAYTVATTLLAGYALWLWRRVRAVRRRLDTQPRSVTRRD